MDIWEEEFDAKFERELKTLKYVKSIIKENNTKEDAKKIVDDFLKYLKATEEFDKDCYNIITLASKAMLKKVSNIEAFNIRRELLKAYIKNEEKESEKTKEKHSHKTASDSELRLRGIF